MSGQPPWLGSEEAKAAETKRTEFSKGTSPLSAWQAPLSPWLSRQSRLTVFTLRNSCPSQLEPIEFERSTNSTNLNANGRIGNNTIISWLQAKRYYNTKEEEEEGKGKGKGEEKKEKIQKQMQFVVRKWDAKDYMWEGLFTFQAHPFVPTGEPGGHWESLVIEYQVPYSSVQS